MPLFRSCRHSTLRFGMAAILQQLPLAALIIASAAHQPNCTFTADQAGPPHGAYKHTHSTSPSDCCSICFEDRKCAAFTFEAMASTCYLGR